MSILLTTHCRQQWLPPPYVIIVAILSTQKCQALNINTPINGHAILLAKAAYESATLLFTTTTGYYCRCFHAMGNAHGHAIGYYLLLHYYHAYLLHI